ncbi:hypothetical protein [Marinilabilia sp.]|uniref:hypothetical protein n=1 Tax=Marinilabilia sp. TaxID=2021252 RepID=UPI0025BFA309|nr:hypothetical protein [Marinilabilia sp.]
MQNLSFITIFLGILIGVVELQAQEQDNLHTFSRDEKNIHLAKDFKGIEIHNQHGDIVVTAWMKDTIQVKIEMSVTATHREMADEVFERLSISITKLNGMAYMRTAFEEEFHSAHPFRINYEIFMPADKQVKIDNRFGNITISDITGKLEINSEYGNVTQTGLQRVDTVVSKISFGEANFKSINFTKTELYNSGLKIENVETASIFGKYCQIDIGKAGILDFSNETARINVDEVKDVNLTGQFCFVSIDEIMKNGKFEISNGLLITSLSEQTNEFSVFNKNAPANINISPELSYTLQGEVTDGNFRHDKDSHFKIISDLNKISFSGEYTNRKEEMATLILFNKNAGINIKTQK